MTSTAPDSVTPDTPNEGAALLAEYDKREGDRDGQLAWVNGLSEERKYVFAQALGARSFERKEEEERRKRRQ